MFVMNHIISISYAYIEVLFAFYMYYPIAQNLLMKCQGIRYRICIRIGYNSTKSSIVDPYVNNTYQIFELNNVIYPLNHVLKLLHNIILGFKMAFVLDNI